MCTNISHYLFPKAFLLTFKIFHIIIDRKLKTQVLKYLLLTRIRITLDLLHVPDQKQVIFSEFLNKQQLHIPKHTYTQTAQTLVQNITPSIISRPRKSEKDHHRPHEEGKLDPPPSAPRAWVSQFALTPLLSSARAESDARVN